VTSGEPDPDASNNAASADTSVICQTDLSVTKRDAPDPVYTGARLTYTLSVSNGGPSDASGVTMIDPLPAELTFASATSGQGSCAEVGGTVTCNLGNMVSGASVPVTIVAVPIAGGTITNAASVAGNETDPNNANNFASAGTTVILVVSIDIRPGNSINPINPKSKGEIRIAILSTKDFRAPADVNKTSLTFGRMGNERSLISCMRNAQDVNHDGMPDLVCRFSTQLAGFRPGDTKGILKGKTATGVLIEGHDSVRIVP
jgi:uncharacterized repeat protein (TIGR01451 family)